MEQYAKQCNQEYLKIVMLKQEETFKHQVNELHRLYKVQTMLMKDVKNVTKEQSTIMERKFWSAENEKCRNQPCLNSSEETQKIINIQLPALKENKGTDFASLVPETDEECDLELTLSIGSKRSRTKKESSITSDSASSFSTISTESKVAKVEDSGSYVKTMAGETKRFKSDGQFQFETKEQIRQDGLKQSPWLSQCLSLNLLS